MDPLFCPLLRFSEKLAAFLGRNWRTLGGVTQHGQMGRELAGHLSPRNAFSAKRGRNVGLEECFSPPGYVCLQGKTIEPIAPANLKADHGKSG